MTIAFSSSMAPRTAGSKDSILPPTLLRSLSNSPSKPATSSGIAHEYGGTTSSPSGPSSTFNASTSPENTLIVFDWDDTFFPTSAAGAQPAVTDPRAEAAAPARAAVELSRTAGDGLPDPRRAVREGGDHHQLRAGVDRRELPGVHAHDARENPQLPDLREADELPAHVQAGRVQAGDDPGTVPEPGKRWRRDRGADGHPPPGGHAAKQHAPLLQKRETERNAYNTTTRGPAGALHEKAEHLAKYTGDLDLRTNFGITAASRLGRLQQSPGGCSFVHLSHLAPASERDDQMLLGPYLQHQTQNRSRVGLPHTGQHHFNSSSGATGAIERSSITGSSSAQWSDQHDDHQNSNSAPHQTTAMSSNSHHVVGDGSILPRLISSSADILDAPEPVRAISKTGAGRGGSVGGSHNFANNRQQLATSGDKLLRANKVIMPRTQRPGAFTPPIGIGMGRR
eukprot:CAMPEP_0179000026 /NCGR_PEP_ID=MMETSP0795-20121207/10425_1 /TAXON_ID=88552 /ORGANISM="Amoebophrya sp., Strain Ameob2" /LENGTH=452 /DNA_ID=CAMNT_0020692941 /DNA_START=390 /DNA_END=1748 /DNA_ORIENTATION=+